MKNPQKPKIEDLKAIGLSSVPNNAVMQAVIAGGIRLAKSGKLETPAGKQERELLAEAASGFNAAVEKAIREELEKLGKFGMNDRTRGQIARAMGPLTSLFQDALTSLFLPDEETLRRVAIYFKPDPDSERPGKSDRRKIAKRIIPPLQRAGGELVRPANKLFNVTTMATEPEDQSNVKNLPPDALATVSRGVIWFVEKNTFSLSDLQMARVILHEAMHLVLGHSISEQDLLYLEDSGITDLNVDKAVKNADSYVGFVMHPVLDSARLPPQFTLRKR